MESKIVHHHEENPEGDYQDEDHHEKKSVLKKVKAKAKKIKDTFKGHGRQDDDHVPDDQADEEDDDPELHDAPMITNTGLPRQGHNSTTPAANFGDTRQGDILKTPTVNFEDTKAARDDPIAPRDHVPGQNQSTGHADFGRPAVRREDLNLGPKPNFSGPTTGEEIAGQPKVNLGEEPHAPQNTPGNHKTTVEGGHDFEQSRVKEEPHTPRANPQAYTPSKTKATDPTSQGSEGVGITPILHSFGKMNLHGVAEHKPHDQSSHGPHDSTATERPSNQSTNTDKISSATPAIADKATSAKNVVASKLGYGGESDQQHDKVPSLSAGSHDQFSQSPHDSTATERPSNQSTTNTDKTSSATPAIADKAASAKNVLASKLGYGGESDQQHNQVSNLSTGSHDQFSQGPHDTEKPSNQSSSYTGQISSAIAGSAVSAKNVVASKLGYGGTDQNHDQQSRGLDPVHDQSGDHVKVGGTVNSGSSAPDQQNQSSTYTEKISSATSTITDRAISAKNVVASKLGYGGTGDDYDQLRDQSGTNSAHDQQGKTIGATVKEDEKVGGTGKESRDYSTSGVNKDGQEKGATVKDYFAEKLKPGEEDKALSEVISNSFHKRKADEPEEPAASAKPVGKVTESEEVKNRLGNTEGNENFVVDRIKGVVGSWFGKSGDQQGSAGAGETEPNRSHVAEDRRPQVSGN